MLIHYFANEEFDYPFSGQSYFTSRRAAATARNRLRASGGEPSSLSSDDAVRMIEERDAEIARLRAMVPVSQWLPGGEVDRG